MPAPPAFIHAASASVSVSGGGVATPSPFIQPPPPDVSFMPPHLSNSPFMLHPPLPAGPPLLHYGFPSEEDTLAYVDALKHSDLSDWRSLQEVARRARAGSCSGAVTTSVLTALYLLGLFNLCAASPASCCVPPPAGRRRRRRNVEATLPPLLNNLQHNLSSLSLEQFQALPHVTTPEGGRIPLHISVVEKVRRLWDSNPRLLSSVSCASATQSVRSSFISLSGVASGIILAYSVAQLSQCYPDDAHNLSKSPPKVWLFPVPTKHQRYPMHIRVIPAEIPVKGENDRGDNCKRTEVPLGYDECVPLLSTSICPVKHWVLFNEETGMGECVPRLCSKNYVYVVEDQLCHDLNEPNLCPGNRRLYLTASGMAVCDCPEGMFPGPDEECYYLYERAFCYMGDVLQFDKASKRLTCKPDPCWQANSNLWPDDLPYAPRKDGYCYQFNSQGPCKAGERFGFDTDKLEATCVSLEEAGLVQPPRAYMYQQMTFPATQDHEYPHYQVSYVINSSPNGASWDLEVKGIGRERRDVSAGRPVNPNEVVVPFLDTREFPHSFELLSSGLHKTEAHSSKKYHRRYHGYRKPRERRPRNKKEQTNHDILNDSFPHYQVSYVMKNSSEGHKWELELKQVGRERRDADQEPSTKSEEKVVPVLDTHKFPQAFEPLMKPRPPTWVTNRMQRRKFGRSRRHRSHNVTSTHLRNRGANYVAKSRGTNPITSPRGNNPTAGSRGYGFHLRHRPIPVTITNVSVIPNNHNTTTPSNSEAETLNRYHGSAFSIGGVSAAPLSSDVGDRDSRNTRSFVGTVSRETISDSGGRPNSRHRSGLRRSESLRDANHRSQTSGRLVAKADTDAGHQNVTAQTPPGPASAERNQAARGGRMRRARGKLGSRQHRAKEEAEEASEDVDGKIEKVHQRRKDRDPSRHRRPDGEDNEDIVKVDQTKGSEPIPVPQEGHNATTSRADRQRGKKVRRRDRGFRKRRGKKRRRGGRGHGRKGRRKNKLETSKNSTRTERKRKRKKNPNLPYRVPTSPPPSATGTSYNTSENVDAQRKNASKSNVETSPTVKVPGTDDDGDTSNRAVEETDKAPASPEGSPKEDGEDEEENEEDGDGDGDGGEDEEKQSSSSEASLPKYLRHRGRRQSAGGIINAPELIQCKPGAEKDYNRKCRPRFIPQEKTRREAGGRPSSTQPAIQCPEGTSLNPLGKCQRTNSALG